MRLAERKGFEPLIRVSPYNGLANRRLQPLGHLSGAAGMPEHHTLDKARTGPRRTSNSSFLLRRKASLRRCQQQREEKSAPLERWQTQG